MTAEHGKPKDLIMRKSRYLVKLGPYETHVIPTLAKIVSNVTNGEESLKTSSNYVPGYGMTTYVYAKDDDLSRGEFADFKKRVKGNRKIGKTLAAKMVNENYVNA